MRGAPALVLPLMMVAAVAIAGVLTFSHPIEDTFPIHRVLAQQLRTGRADSNFTPLGYPWLLSRVPVDSIDTAIRLVHFSCYLALVLVTVLTLRRLGGWNAPVGIAAAVFVFFNPYVLLNLYRLNDTNVAMLLTLAFFAALVCAVDAAAPSAAFAAAGAVLALLIVVRPNAITLAPMLAFPIWRSSGASRQLLLRRGIAAALIGIVTYIVLSLAIARVPLFWPSNGPYNLFAGNNPAAIGVLRADYNAETSLDEGLAWCGVEGPVRGASGAQFITCAARFVRESPVKAVELTLFKCYNLLWRPNLRLADSVTDVLAQLAMVAPSILWALALTVVLVRSRRVLDPLTAVFVACFALPLIATNTDPRFRLPLDPLFALSLASPPAMAMVRESLARRSESRPPA